MIADRYKPLKMAEGAQDASSIGVISRGAPAVGIHLCLLNANDEVLAQVFVPIEQVGNLAAQIASAAARLQTGAGDAALH